jgi:hypothetical protein
MFGVMSKAYAIFLKENLSSNPMIERFEFNEDEYKEIKDLQRIEQSNYNKIRQSSQPKFNETKLINTLNDLVRELDKLSGFLRSYRAADRKYLVNFIGAALEI